MQKRLACLSRFCARTKHLDNLKPDGMVHYIEKIVKKLGFPYNLIFQKTLYSEWINIVIEDIFQFWQLD